MTPCRRDAIDAPNIESTAVDDGLTYHSYAHRCCCAGEGLFNTKLTGPGEVFLQSYSHGLCGNQISGAPRDIVPVEVREGPRSR